MVEVDLLDFVENCTRPAKRALGRHAGEPEVGGLARWQHVVVHCLRIEDEYSYREPENRLEYTGDIREVLDLDRDDVPGYRDYRTSKDTPRPILSDGDSDTFEPIRPRTRRINPSVRQYYHRDDRRHAWVLSDGFGVFDRCSIRNR